MKHLKLFEDFQDQLECVRKISDLADKIWSSKNKAAIDKMHKTFDDFDLKGNSGYDPEDLYNLEDDEAQIILSQLYKIS